MASGDIDKPTASSLSISLAPTSSSHPSSSHSSSPDSPVHGLTYPPSLLPSLPILTQRPPPHEPIRVLSASQFRDIHMEYLTSHAPDSVIFPFLHGLEGNNEAQNAFFANASSAPWKDTPKVECEDGAEGRGNKGRIYPEIPRFRGLVWVAANHPAPSTSPISPASTSQNGYHSEDYSDCSSTSSEDDSEDELEVCDDYTAMNGMRSIGTMNNIASMSSTGVAMEIDMDMDMDGVGELEREIEVEMSADPALKGPVVKVPPLNSKEENHMHPVLERTHIHESRDRRASTTSTCTTLTAYSSTTDECPSPTSASSSSPTTHESPSSPTSPPLTPPSLSNSPFSPPASPVLQTPPSVAPIPIPHSSQPGKINTSIPSARQAGSISSKSPLPPPLLTSTFKPHELLKPVPPPHPAQRKERHPWGYTKDGRRNEVEVKGLKEAARIVGGAGPVSDCGGGDGREGGSEFVDLKVPEGISLRNFGIQVPIFVTLSDIVVYSPTGDTQSAVTLAQRFKEAIEKKYEDRLARIRAQLRGDTEGDDGAGESATPRPRNARRPASASLSDLTPEEQEEADRLIKYNVFVLDATPEEIYEKLEHLVTRVEDVSVPHAHTDGTDAHTIGDPGTPSSASSSEGSMDADVTMGVGKVKAEKEKRKKKKVLRANTINFAQREKEEMRDLTRASELYTAFPPDHPLDPCSRTPRHPEHSPAARSPTPHTPPSSSSSHTSSEERIQEISGSTTTNLWDPSLGQIFLGNASDVPLPDDDDTRYERERKRLKRAKRFNAHHRPHHHHHDNRMDEDEDQDLSEEEEEVFDFRTNDPAQGMGFDLCIECDDMAPFPSSAQMRAVEEHVGMLERVWAERSLRRFEREHVHVQGPSTSSNEMRGSSADVPMDGVEDTAGGGDQVDRVTIPPRPPPNANAVVHLSFPSSVSYTPNLIPFINWLETLVKPVSESLVFDIVREPKPPRMDNDKDREGERERAKPPFRRGSSAGNGAQNGFSPSSLPPPTAFQNTFLPSSHWSGSSLYQRVRSTSATYPNPSSGSVSSTSSSSRFSPVSPSSRVPSQAYCHHPHHQRQPTPPPQHFRTRPLKILIYSADGYTESSSLALCLLMALRKLTLPEAYLELQIEKKRSFFVYQNEVGAMKRVEGRLEKERQQTGYGYGYGGSWGRTSGGGWTSTVAFNGGGRPPAQSVSFASPPSSFFGSSCSSGHTSASRTMHMNETQVVAGHHQLSSSIPTESSVKSMMGIATRRQRASTMSVLPSFTDHQAWFNDPRFDGSFPSRVLPFLYLGNLNHASNVYMLHALGITHVVSVGECALVPPPSHAPTSSAEHSHTYPSACQFVPGKGPGGHGSLWIEEREGRIKVLDIKGVCDDGIDTLEPQLAPICDWIDRARAEGGKVLVHCRVGVSRSATVTIAYVMKHLNLPLVDAYLIVRSRRLSVLIQPNMRLLYNLLGWEVKLAQERAGDSKEKLRHELSRCLNWPYLAKEVHALNEKYLH